jgi:hypothetical protein
LKIEAPVRRGGMFVGKNAQPRLAAGGRGGKEREGKKIFLWSLQS